MSGGGESLVSIPLRDGTQLSVTSIGVQIGDRLFELARIQDARQVAPDPETVALRVAGAGLVEFQPARPGDGTVALEALFRLRPDLLPAGFTLPSDAPVYPPPPSIYPPYPPPAGYPLPSAPGASLPRGGYLPPRYGFSPGAAPHSPYGLSPNARQGELTPHPRSIGEILSAIFQLYGKHFRTWLGLGFWVLLIPGIVVAAAQVGFSALAGLDPLAIPSITATTIAGSCQIQLPAMSTHDLIARAAIASGGAVVGLLVNGWQVAVLASAGREAVLGRAVLIGPNIRRGTRRLLATLGASLAVLLIFIGMLVPAGVCLGISIAGLLRSNALCDPQAVTAADSVYALLSFAGLFLLLVGGILALFLVIRLVLAPVIAATEDVGVGSALRRSWRLTHHHWWRCFGVVILIALITILILMPVVTVFDIIQLIPGALVTLLVTLLLTPVAQWLTVPFQELAYVVLLFDLRLRREGYEALTKAASAAPSHTSPPPPS